MHKCYDKRRERTHKEASSMYASAAQQADRPTGRHRRRIW